MISSIGQSYAAYDPWVIPDPSKLDSCGVTIPLLLALSYVAIQSVGALTKPSLGLPRDVKPDKDPCLSSLMKLHPLSSSCSESLATSIHVTKMKRNRSRWRKQRQRGNPLAFGHHANGMSLASGNHCGEMSPTFGHHVGDKQLDSSQHVDEMSPASRNHARDKSLASAS